MNKKEIGKEIEALIRSIKLHYDNVALELRIPTIELELITAKIRKLHEKSIVFNHLHMMEEQMQRLEQIEREIYSNDDETPAENFIINASEISTPLVAHIPAMTRSNEPNVTETTLNKNLNSVDEKANTPIDTNTNHVQKAVEVIQEKPIQTETPQTEIVGKDLKKIIGFSDKYFFISKLFNGNADDFNASISILNLCSTIKEAEVIIHNLKQKNAWTDDNEALQSLKHYLQNKYN